MFNFIFEFDRFVKVSVLVELYGTRWFIGWSIGLFDNSQTAHEKCLDFYLSANDFFVLENVYVYLISFGL